MYLNDSVVIVTGTVYKYRVVKKTDKYWLIRFSLMLRMDEKTAFVNCFGFVNPNGLPDKVDDKTQTTLIGSLVPYEYTKPNDSSESPITLRGIEIKFSKLILFKQNKNQQQNNKRQVKNVDDNLHISNATNNIKKQVSDDDIVPDDIDDVNITQNDDNPVDDDDDDNDSLF